MFIFICVSVLYVSISAVPNLIICDHIAGDASKIGLANHRYYANLHGYAYFQFVQPFSSDPFPTWTKLSLILNLFHPPFYYDYVLWMDSDAIFYNLSQKIEDIVDFKSNPDLVASGETHVINAGVMLLRNTKWVSDLLILTLKLRHVYESGPVFGAGCDNNVLSAVLGGCTLKSSYNDIYEAYQRNDRAYIEHNQGRSELFNALSNGNIGAFQSILSPDILLHYKPLPQTIWNSYYPENAKFILHFAGRTRKEKNALLKKYGRNKP